MVRGLPFDRGLNEQIPLNQAETMKTRNIIALAAFGGLLAAAACKGKNEYGADSTGTAAMSDTTGMSAGTTGTMTDSTGMTTGTSTTDSVPYSSGDTTTKR
jgi:hypothetical protein